MFGIFNAVVAVAMSLGAGSVGGGSDDGIAVMRPAGGFTVHFENTASGYPVRASLTFATRAEAETFAQAKRQHGYIVRINEGR